MNCLRSLERWDRGLGSQSRYGVLRAFIVFVLSCVYVAALRRACHSSKEFYRLCIDYGSKKAAMAHKVCTAI
jgi:hypothetical protein